MPETNRKIRTRNQIENKKTKLRFIDLHENRLPEDSNRLFPVFLKLENLNTLIVGGGSVGFEKLRAVLKNSPEANVTLVAPSIKEEILLLSEEYPNVQIIPRAFQNSDLKDKDVIISAANNRELNSVIREEARKNKILINVADTPDLCDFYLSSVVQKGSVKLAISTNGKSPTIAKRLREFLEKTLPDELENVLDNLVGIRSKLSGNFSEKVKILNKITSVLVENLQADQSESKLKNETSKKTFKFKKITKFLFGSLIIIFSMIAGHLFFQNVGFSSLKNSITQIISSLNPGFHWYIIVGFIAQMIDGALGMAYGVSATAFLLALGYPPAVTSASVHASEVFTCGASGFFHLKFGNVSKKLFKNLLIPGVIGAVLGAYFLSSLSEYNFIVKPVIAAYTLVLGIVILFKSRNKRKNNNQIKHIASLAGIGGLLDSMGGGGWGPIMSSTLIAKGKHPLITIGSVNLAEFFVALSSSAAFVTFIGLTHWQIIIGLVIGGITAAPIAAKIAGKLPVKTMMILVGILVIALSLRILFTSFW
ncbi:MAG TPA: TSUP family transporter [Ignavibacteriaceae bacterium]|nr:TSUP family transporter [Ignavibacteriaceae bacterium]